MWSVLMLFILPFGGGIPAGVLLAVHKGLAWPWMALIYFFSDVVLAIVFEPILNLSKFLARKMPFVERVKHLWKKTMSRTSLLLGQGGNSPFILFLIAFGVDPLTGRTAALAEGHGFLSGWALAIAGDMFYFTVVSVTTLQLNQYCKNSRMTVLIILAMMITIPMLIRAFHASQRKLCSVPLKKP